MMKRFAVHEGEMARVLMLMSHGQEPTLPLLPVAGRAPERVFVCKTCNRTFPSFQALGGHRASHKRPRASEAAPRRPARTGARCAASSSRSGRRWGDT